jgi:hypothetical protein
MNLRLATSSPADIGTCASPARRAPAGCERLSTPRHTTLRFAALALAVLAAACGGGGGKKRGDTYAAATSAQEGCCEQLTAGPREDCLREIVRVPDEAVAHSDANQDTYACVQEHFACDPGTGHATQASAQAQLDCIQDLP